MKQIIFILILTTVFCIKGRCQFSYNKQELEKLILFNEKMKTDRLIVSINDTIITDQLYRGKKADLYSIYSITKIFSGIAIGILIDQKKIENPEIKVSTYFEEWKTDPQKDKITIRHLLQHVSGLQANKGSQDIYPQSDFVEYALQGNVSSKPGVDFFYNNKALNLISGIVYKITEKSLEHFISENLFQPLQSRKHMGNGWTLVESGRFT